MITINSAFVTVLVSSLIPIAVGVVTHSKASSSLKALLSILFNAIQALIVSSMTADGSSVISKQTFILWIVGVATSAATYMGVWKPTGLAQKLLPNIGLGAPTIIVPDEAPPTDSSRADLPA